MFDDNDEDKSLTMGVDRAARLLGIGRDACYNAIRAGQLPSIRMGRKILVPKVALARLLNLGAAQ